MIPFTAAQREALRLLVGITPETHPIYFPLRPCKVCERSIVSEQGFSGGLCSCGQFRLAEGKSNWLPCPLTGGDEADDVWLAPVLRWLHNNNRLPTLDSLIPGDCDPCPSAQVYGGSAFGFAQFFADTFTAALLLAARAAGVPEVCAIFDMGEEG